MIYFFSFCFFLMAFTCSVALETTGKDIYLIAIPVFSLVGIIALFYADWKTIHLSFINKARELNAIDRRKHKEKKQIKKKGLDNLYDEEELEVRDLTK